jgi:hypothetical protein
MDKPYGNLTFDNYTFSTDTEKLIVALQASMKTGGYTEKSAGWKKLHRLKRALKRDKRYSFKLLPKEKVAPSPQEEKIGPSHDLSPILSEVVSHCLGVELRKVSVKNTSAGYAVVTAVCAGLLSDLRIPPGPEFIITEDRFKREVVERCFRRDSRFSSVRVMGIFQKRKNKHCLATVEVVYK